MVVPCVRIKILIIGPTALRVKHAMNAIGYIRPGEFDWKHNDAILLELSYFWSAILLPNYNTMLEQYCRSMLHYVNIIF